MQNIVSQSWFPDFDHLLVVISDIEMGAKGLYNDFPHDKFLADILSTYQKPPYDKFPVDFVFNGDTFDLLKTSYEGTYPHHISEDIALAKMSLVASSHATFFEAIRDILSERKSLRRVFFMIGNHDYELLFPLVQDFIKALCGNSPHVYFPGFKLVIGPVQIEHGAQSDPLFRIDPEKPFITSEGKKLLNISWATVALLDVIIPLQPILYFHDRLKPQHKVMELMPEIKDLLVGLAWKYWTKDFWRNYLKAKDPVLKLNWTMIKEIVKRFGTTSTDPGFDESWLRETSRDNPSKYFIKGHLHEAGNRYFGNSRFLTSDCFRDEYMVFNEGKIYKPRLKFYFEIFFKGDNVTAIQNREVRGPDRSPEELPESIFDVKPKVIEALEQLDEKSKDRAERRKIEIEEAKEK